MRKQSGIYDSVSSQGRVGKQGNADNCVFGGPDMKTLFITGDGGLFSIRLKIPGVPAGVTALRAPLSSSKQASAGLETGTRDVKGRLVTPASRIPAVKVPLAQ